MAVRARLQRLFASRWALALATLLAVLVSAPSLGAGFAGEDYLFRVAAQRPGLDLFDAQDVALGVDAARRSGSLPWITPDDFAISFLRPLSSLTHRLDYTQWLESAWAAHLHSVFWYALAVLAAGLVFRRVLPARAAAGIATLLFAIDDAHAHAVGWIANRHVLIGTAAALLALWAHDRWRRDGWRAGAVLSPLCLSAALFSSEAALGVLGYFAAHAMLLDRKRQRLLALVPAAAVTAGWAVVFRQLGHGARGSGLYVDPSRHPALFFADLPERAGALLLAQLGAPPADTWHELGSAGQLMLAVAGALLLVAIVALAPRTRTTGFFALGLLASIVPLCATFPSDRLLYLPGLGAFGLIAELLVAMASRDRLRTPRLVVGFGLIVVHALVAPAWFPWRSLTMARFHQSLVAASDSAYDKLSAAQQQLVVVNSPDFYFCKMMREVRWTRGLPAGPIFCMSGSLGPLELERIDPNALRVRVTPSFLDRPFNRLYRDRAHPMQSGDRVFVGAAQVQITDTDSDGAPSAAEFRFVWPVDSERLRFVQWQDGRYTLFVPPRIGQRRSLDASR